MNSENNSKADTKKVGLKITTVVLLLLVTFLIPFFSAQNFSPSNDEMTHLSSGYSYWKTKEIIFNTQHPPLVKLLASAPLLFLKLNFGKIDPNLKWDEWQFGKQLLFNNNADKLLLLGRLAPILISVLLGFYIFKWASELFSYEAGILSLFLYAFMPNIIAHAQFITTDLAVTAFSFITLYYLWKLFGFPRHFGSTQGGGGLASRKKFLIFASTSLGLALASKFSAILLVPIVVFLMLVYFWKGESSKFLQVLQVKPAETLKSKELLGYFVLLGAIGFGVVYVTYLFPHNLNFYLKGLNSVYADISPTFHYYLNGHFSQSGWWYYFIIAFLIKTPIPALIAFALAIAAYKKHKLTGLEKLIIFLPILVFLIFTSWKAKDMGVRYILPIYPFLILYAGGLAELKLFNKKTVLVATVGLGIWYVFSAVRIYPDYLAYFNESVGGPANGYKYLDDSNLEWGQDLKRLKAYQTRHPETKVIYSWRRSDPAYYGISNDLFASGFVKQPLQNPSGRYAININFLIRMKLEAANTDDKYLDWLSLYKPIDRIGYSFFVYQF